MLEHNIIIPSQDLFKLIEILDTECDEKEKEGLCLGISLHMVREFELNPDSFLTIFKYIEELNTVIKKSTIPINNISIATTQHPRLIYKISKTKEFFQRIRVIQNPEKFFNIKIPDDSLFLYEQLLNKVYIDNNPDYKLVLIKKWLTYFPSNNSHDAYMTLYFDKLLKTAKELNQDFSMIISASQPNQSHAITLFYRPHTNSIVIVRNTQAYVINETKIDQICNAIFAGMYSIIDDNWSFYLTFEIYSSQQNIKQMNIFVEQLKDLPDNSLYFLDNNPNNIDNDFNKLTQYNMEIKSPDINQLSKNTFYFYYKTAEDDLFFDFNKFEFECPITYSIDHNSICDIINQDEDSNNDISPEQLKIELHDILQSQKDEILILAIINAKCGFMQDIMYDLILIGNYRAAQKLWPQIQEKNQFEFCNTLITKMPSIIETRNLAAVKWALEKINFFPEFKKSERKFKLNVVNWIYQSLSNQNRSIAECILKLTNISYEEIIKIAKNNSNLAIQAKYIEDFFLREIILFKPFYEDVGHYYPTTLFIPPHNRGEQSNSASNLKRKCNDNNKLFENKQKKI